MQAKLWQLSARLVKLDGYDPLELTPPAPEDPVGKDKVKKNKKTKKEKGVATDKPDEAAVVENGHAAENGETEKCDKDKEKRDLAEDMKEDQTEKGDKIEDIAENGDTMTADKKQETVCNNGECKTTTSDDSHVPPTETDVQTVEINGGDCNTASE